MTKKTLNELYKEHQGKVSDKWSIYLHVYNEIFTKYRDDTVRLLEIGVQNGGSLEIWAKYFSQAERLIGCDINPDCASLTYNDPKFTVIVGDANSNPVQDTILALAPSFNIIIDDGSHLSSDIVKSFARYFPYLEEGGVFVIEDLHCSYWQEFEGGLFDPFSSLAFFKRLADVLSHEHWGVNRPCSDVLKSFFSKYNFKIDDEVLLCVHSVEFINSLCVIKKKAPKYNEMGRRFIAGSEEVVVPGHLALHGSQGLPLSQAENKWAMCLSPPEEELPLRVKELMECKLEIDSLKQVIEKQDEDNIIIKKKNIENEDALARLNQELIDSRQMIHALLTSASWRLTYVLRLLKSIITLTGMPVYPKGYLDRFNAAWYIEQNPDVNKTGMDPYEHYLKFGKAEGRQPRPRSFLSRNLKRLFLLLAIAPNAVQRSGGAFRLAHKAGSVLKAQGWRGVRSKIVNLIQERHSHANKLTGFNRNDYKEWVRRYDTLNNEARSIMQSRIDDFENKPLISIIMPVYNPKPEWLREAIESVRKQIYSRWELCIADDASTNSEIQSVLQHYISVDSRIKVDFREKNGHISAASNSALALVTGEWVALFDHDDLLAEHALFWVVDAINKKPRVRLFYSDEDKIDENNERLGPYFKCDWNVDLFYSQNMISHLGVYKATMMREVNGFRVGLEGSQDYDLALRCIERLNADQIYHIPRVLYHWRVHAESTAASVDAKPYALLAGERALNDHFSRQGIKAKAECIGVGYRARYQLPERCLLVSLIIPARNGLQLMQQCVESILGKTTYPNYEILIIDNASDDPATLSYFESLAYEPKVRVLKDPTSPFNFSALNNNAVKKAQGDVIALIDNDIEVISPDWLNEMVSLVVQPQIGAVGANLWYPNDTLRHGGVVLGLGGCAGHAHKGFARRSHGYFSRASSISSFSAVTAACLVVRKEVYEEVNGLNEVELKVAFNDVDFCLRVREAGYRNVLTPYAELYHHESLEDTVEKQSRLSKEVAYMKARWGEQLMDDPAYSPNLTLDYEDFSYAWPPRVEMLSKEQVE